MPVRCVAREQRPAETVCGHSALNDRVFHNVRDVVEVEEGITNHRAIHEQRAENKNRTHRERSKPRCGTCGCGSGAVQVFLITIGGWSSSFSLSGWRQGTS